MTLMNNKPSLLKLAMVLFNSVEIFRDPTLALAHAEKDQDSYDQEVMGLRGRVRITTRCMWIDGGRLLDYLRQVVDSALLFGFNGYPD